MVRTASILTAGALLVAGVVATHAAAGNPPCGEVTFTNPQGGTTYRVLFAKNGAVQAYQLVRSSDNPELDHDTQRILVRRYGPEGIGAPPVRILSYKPSTTPGLMLPDKAIDSCGRITYFR